MSETKVAETDLGVVLYGPTEARPYYRLVYRDRNGKRVAKSAGKSYEGAWNRMLDADAEVAASVTPQSGRTVRELTEAFLADFTRHWSDRHAADTAGYLGKALVDLWDVPCWELSRDMVSAALDSARTVSMRRHYRAAVGKLLTWGYDEDWLTQPRSALVKALPKTAKADHGREHGESHLYVDPDLIPSAEDCRAVAEAMFEVGGEKHGEQAWLMAAVAASTGLRQGELFDLRKGRLLFAKNDLRVLSQVVWVKGQGPKQTRPKWGRTRTTVLPERTIWGDPLAQRLEAFVEGLGSDDLVFPAPRGGWLHPSNFSRDLWKPAREACPVWEAGWGWHSLRHAFCSHLLSGPGGAGRVADVSKAAGHRDSYVTMAMYVSATKGVTGRLNDALA